MFAKGQELHRSPPPPPPLAICLQISLISFGFGPALSDCQDACHKSPLIPLRLPCPDNLATPKHITDKCSATRKDMRAELHGGSILTHTHRLAHTQRSDKANRYILQEMLLLCHSTNLVFNRIRTRNNDKQLNICKEENTTNSSI